MTPTDNYAYYNDNNAFCCQVLRKNIENGNLPKGLVDGRDIREVRAADLMGYQHIHLFAGIGGFPYGLQLANFPSSIRVLTAGFPCQPHSLAGKRQASKDERNLWPDLSRLIRAFKPRWLLCENVLGLLSSEDGAFFGSILRDLAQAGYDVEWCVLRASDVGAPHQRERVFLVAYPNGLEPQRGRNARKLGSTQGASQSDSQQWQRIWHTTYYSSSAMAHSQGNDEGWMRSRTTQALTRSTCTGESVEDTTSSRCEVEQNTAGIYARSLSANPLLADTSSTGREEFNIAPITGEQGHAARRNLAPGSPTGSGGTQSVLGRVSDGISCWLDRACWPARPGSEQHKWEVSRTTTGKQAHRVDRLKALGNAIVPQLVAVVAGSIMAFEQDMEEVA